jgi:hypothetical protein
MSKQNKKNKKANNIGTAMHTVSYLGQPYIKSDYKKQLTLREIVENQEKHMMLIPRSEEDQSYIEELEASIVKDIPDEVILKKCETYFTRKYRDDIKLDEEKISKIFEQKYCVRKTDEKIDVKKAYDALFDKNHVEPEPEIEPHTSDQKLNLRCHCHNCNGNFPLRNLKWVDIGVKSIPSFFDAETPQDLLDWCTKDRSNFDAVRKLMEGKKISVEMFNTKNTELIEIIKKSKSNKDAEIYDTLSKNDKYYGIRPMCAKYPMCPSSWSVFDLWLKKEQYSLEDHKKGKYDR